MKSVEPKEEPAIEELRLDEITLYNLYAVFKNLRDKVNDVVRVLNRLNTKP
jgi:hypothetical protein